ncbi:MAG: 50S ribosomal protein L9 [Planctomycetota bacterium]
MRIILLETVNRLGRRGDVVTVRDGFARNYLIPRNVACEASPGNMSRVEALKKRFAQEEAERLGRLKELAQRIGSTSVKIQAKVSPEGSLYGSVNAATLREALLREQIDVEERTIKLDEPIKAAGVFTVPVLLHGDIKADLKVFVVAEESTVPAPA